MGGLPVRTGGSESTASLRGAIRLLQEGKFVGVFPEGRVMPEGELGPLHPGAAMLAARLHVPVIPVAVRGSSRAWPHGKSLPRPAPVSVRIGSPIAPPTTGDRAAIDELLDRIRTGLHELAEEEPS
jgi:1-acyl-sn-glycerol-3-phosphate acyltransferase